jgi:hypothetical protein
MLKLSCLVLVRTCFVLAVALALRANAQTGTPANPRVPYVPTPQEVVERMLHMARVTPDDYLIDLGSGDGRIVITAAARHGARGFGVDINPERIAEAEANGVKHKVTGKVAFYQRDLFATDLSQATVISMYLLPRVNMELRPRLLALKPGTRIVSHDFDMGDWKPDQYARMETNTKYDGAGGDSEIFLWIVPASVAGDWRWELALRGRKLQYTASLGQQFQQVGGHVTVNGHKATVRDARMNGEELRLAFTVDWGEGPVRHELTGRVAGGALHGVAALSGARAQGRHEWAAERSRKGLE